MTQTPYYSIQWTITGNKKEMSCQATKDTGNLNVYGVEEFSLKGLILHDPGV